MEASAFSTSSTFYKDNAHFHFFESETSTKKITSTDFLYRIVAKINNISCGPESELVIYVTKDNILHYVTKIIADWNSRLEKVRIKTGGDVYFSIDIDQIMETFDRIEKSNLRTPNVITPIHWKYQMFDEYILSIEQVYVNPK